MTIEIAITKGTAAGTVPHIPRFPPGAFHMLPTPESRERERAEICDH
jgi:hypothetical protein